jgi:hypothetical protein
VPSSSPHALPPLQRYEEWRRVALRVPLLRRLRRRAARAAVVTLLPAAAMAFAAVHDFDWPRMKGALKEAKEGIVASVAGRRRRGGRFLDLSEEWDLSAGGAAGRA